MVLLAHAITLLQSLNKTIHTQIRRRSPKIKAHWCIRIRQLPHQEQGNAGVTGYGSDVTALSVPRWLTESWFCCAVAISACVRRPTWTSACVLAEISHGGVGLRRRPRTAGLEGRGGVVCITANTSPTGWISTATPCWAATSGSSSYNKAST